jgi:hypothetical protein
VALPLLLLLPALRHLLLHLLPLLLGDQLPLALPRLLLPLPRPAASA